MIDIYFIRMLLSAAYSGPPVGYLLGIELLLFTY